MDGNGVERFETMVIGSGQAGLSTGYYLKEAGRSFVIVDAHDRVGGSWLSGMTRSSCSHRPGRSSSLVGVSPGRAGSARRRTRWSTTSERTPRGSIFPCERACTSIGSLGTSDGYVLSVGGDRIEADNVIVASGADQGPEDPFVLSGARPGIVQFHSSEYRNPSQLREGGVLVVGAGNSGADVSLDVVGSHPTWLSGPDRGHVPVDVDKWFAQNVAFRIIRFVGLHVMTIRTPIGRKAKRKYASQGDMLVRVKPKQILAGGVQRVPKTVGVRGGKPVLEDGRVLDVANVIWCTGFRHDLSWIDLPIFGEDGELLHERGVVTTEPGLYFVGLFFQYSAGSDVIPGVGRDAKYVVKHLVAQAGTRPNRAEMTTAA